MSALDPDRSIAKHLIVSDEAKDTRDFLDNDTFGLSTPEGRASYSLVDRSDLPLTLPPEVEEGNIEYKLKLVNPSQNRFEHLITQMKWRLDEGGGQAIYRLGVDDNGAVSGLTVTEMAASLSTIYRMARRLGASLSLLRECTVEHSSAQSSPTNQADALPFHRKAVELLVQRHLLVNQGLPDLCIAMLGSVDAGKSTLLGILTDGELDNGRGRARLNLFRHLHEVQTGRTSSLSSEVIGFDAAGRLINRQRSKGRLTRRTVDEVVRDSNRLITLLDLAGHPKYQRTTLSGLARSQPTFAALVVSTTCGLTPEGLDHARTAAALGLPLVVVITKIDLLTEASPQETPTPTEEAVPLSSLLNSASAPDLQVRTSLHPVVNTTVHKHMKPSVTNAVTAIRQDIVAKLKAIRSSSLLPNGELLVVECFKADLPVFALSSVSGAGLNDLLVFLARVSAADFTKTDLEGLLLFPSGVNRSLPCRSAATAAAVRDEDAVGDSLAPVAVEFSITKVFWHVPGVKNPVLAGLLTTGQIHENQKLWLGPNETGQFFPVLVVEIRRNRQPHKALYCGQMGSLALATEPIDKKDEKTAGTDGDFLLDSVRIRRGMVLLNRHPLCPDVPSIGLSGETVTTAAVSWSFSVSSIVWVPCATTCGKTCRSIPAVNSTVAVYSGSVCQHAKVVDVTIDPKYWSKLISVSELETSLLRLDPTNNVILRFLRQPEYLVPGRQVILSFDSGAKAVGFIDALCDTVTLFSEPVPSMTGSSIDCTSPCIPPAESLWQTVGTETDLQKPATSLDDLLAKVGLLKRSPDSEMAAGVPHADDFTSSAETVASNLSEAKTRRPEKLRRLNKRRHKAQVVFDRIIDVSTPMNADLGSRPTPLSSTSDTSPATAISGTCCVTYLTAKLNGCRCFAASPPEEPKITNESPIGPEESTFVPQSVSSAPPHDPPPMPLGRTRKRVRKHRRRRRHHKT
ncbi:hypothetical protein AAHC03_04860 [Spirometra sp. Aus1]